MAGIEIDARNLSPSGIKATRRVECPEGDLRALPLRNQAGTAGDTGALKLQSPFGNPGRFEYQLRWAAGDRGSHDGDRDGLRQFLGRSM